MLSKMRRELRPEFLDSESKRWTLDSGPWTLDSGRWVLDTELWTLDAGLWKLDARLWTLDSGLWTLDAGRWTLDTGLWTLNPGLWTLDAGLRTLNARMDVKTLKFKTVQSFGNNGSISITASLYSILIKIFGHFRYENLSMVYSFQTTLSNQLKLMMLRRKVHFKWINMIFCFC